jgi:uncharacterized BrkB/YihY/UPF0761 family membrane protein
MKDFRSSAQKHSRASARIGILGSAFLIMLWIGLSASAPSGGAIAAETWKEFSQEKSEKEKSIKNSLGCRKCKQSAGLCNADQTNA